jgi:hypothetical protein
MEDIFGHCSHSRQVHLLEFESVAAARPAGFGFLELLKAVSKLSSARLPPSGGWPIAGVTPVVRRPPEMHDCPRGRVAYLGQNLLTSCRRRTPAPSVAPGRLPGRCADRSKTTYRGLLLLAGELDGARVHHLRPDRQGGVRRSNGENAGAVRHLVHHGRRQKIPLNGALEVEVVVELLVSGKPLEETQGPELRLDRVRRGNVGRRRGVENFDSGAAGAPVRGCAVLGRALNATPAANAAQIMMPR